MHRGLFTFGLLALAAGSLCGQEDPPSRVARLNYVNGSVSFRPDSVQDWAPASLNYPLTTGDHLWCDRDSGAELHIGADALRLAGETAVNFLNLNDQVVQVSVTQGFLNIRLRSLEPGETFEVDTPNTAVTLLRPGEYRIDVNPDASTTRVTVRAGDAEVTGAGQAFPVHSGQTGQFADGDGASGEIMAAEPPDAWDRWAMDRDRREDEMAAASERYVSRGTIGCEDLGAYGVWRTDPAYGPVWAPRVAAGWAPYRYGRWVWVAPWGWTWIDDAPWGFAPFHYGRWAMAGGGWVWVPGARVARPVYAPALVAFVGGPGFRLSVAAEGAAGVAWFPLGPREPYIPPYRVSQVYVRHVNVTEVNVTNVNVTNTRYMNRTYVTAVPENAFVTARPVGRAAVRLAPAEINNVRVVNRIELQPRREAMLGREVGPGARIAAPPAAAFRRPVFARTAPPPRVADSAPVRMTRPATGFGRPAVAGDRPAARGDMPSYRSNAPQASPKPANEGRSFGRGGFPERTMSRPAGPPEGSHPRSAEPSSRGAGRGERRIEQKRSEPKREGRRRE